VLPDIVAEDGMKSLRDGTVLIGSADDFHFAFAVSGEPDPSAAELSYAGGIEFFLESLEVAEGFLNDIGDGAGGIASAVGLHDVPEHGVVDVTSAVVADSASNIFGDGVQVFEQVFGSLLIELGMFVEGRVEVLDVGSVMHVVMEMHGLFIDGRVERRVVVRQGGQFVRHFHFLQSLCHFLFLQTIKDDEVRLKDSCGAGLVVSAARYICNIFGFNGWVRDGRNVLDTTSELLSG
jgi:hypothetical protein